MSRSNDNKMRSLNTWKRQVFIVKGKIKNLILVTYKNQNTRVRNKHVSVNMISLQAQHFGLKKPKGPRTDLEVKRSQRDRIFVCTHPGPPCSDQDDDQADS